MKTRIAITMSLCMLLMPLGITSQSERLAEDVQYGISLRGTGGGGDNVPFWFTNNRYGLGPVDNNSFLARAYIKRDAETDTLMNWRIGFGADMAAPMAGLIIEAYLKGKLSTTSEEKVKRIEKKVIR